MPFTVSHAVVALPFLRSPLVPSAIAVGAMTPDLPLFVRGAWLHYGRTHDLLWLPVTVAVAAVLFLLWRCVLRPAVRELAPSWLAARLPAQWDSDAATALRKTVGGHDRGGVSWRHAAVIVLSLAVGVVTHVVWDQFTHEGRWGVVVLPALEAHWGPLPGYTWLQHASSLVGMALLAVWAMSWLAHRRAVVPVRLLPGGVRALWWASLPVTIVAAWLIGLAMLGPLTAAWTPTHLAYRVLPPACALWGAVTLVLCLVVQLRRGRGNAAS